jgi:VWFA-related protein
VTVDALVTREDRPISGLQASDFEVRDNGVLQEIDSVSVDDAPISMLLALDTSNSVGGPTLDHLKRAAIAAVDSLTPNDRAAILTFAESVNLGSDWGAVSADTRLAIAGAAAGGSTSLYDAAYAALTLKDTVPGRRFVVLVFSDGGDTSSWLPARALLERARRTDAVVYVVTRQRPGGDVRLEYRSGIELWTQDGASRTGTPPMLELANLTGGDVFIAQRADQLRAAFSAVVHQFRTRYLLTYRPRGVDVAAWHTIDVRLKRGKATIKARRGYAG